MRARRILCSAAILLGVAANTPPAAALTAGEVLEEMSEAEQTAYMFGSAEMAAFLAHVAGDAERSRCISAWFRDKGVAQIVQTMDALRDRQAQPMIHTLIGQACGK